MTRCISFTPTQLKVLRDCVRIAIEDGSIEGDKRRSAVIDALIEKLDAARKPSR